MMHLKNITAGNPKTKEQYQLTKQFNIKWLYSDDGKNWYEEQKNFQPDTLKMVYDHNGVIICIEINSGINNFTMRQRKLNLIKQDFSWGSLFQKSNLSWIHITDTKVFYFAAFL